jgi:DNA polymerase I-like protein with 3'-5' exonuclease and polymerase domains
MGLPAKKRGKKSEDWSTDADVLDGLAKDGYEIAQHIIEWRSVSKLKSTYADPLVKQVCPVKLPSVAHDLIALIDANAWTCISLGGH